MKLRCADCQKAHHVPRKGEAEDVNGKENHVGHLAVEHTQNGQRARIVRGDVEHIKGLVGVAESAVEQVCRHSNANENRERRQRLQNRLMRELCSARNVHKYADYDHHAVVDHRLDVDADGFDEYVTGVEHNRGAREQAVGCHKRAQRVLHLAVWNERRHQKNVHGCSAELEGEGVPLIAPFTGCRIEREVQLFVRFQKDKRESGGPDDEIKRFVGEISRS